MNGRHLQAGEHDLLDVEDETPRAWDILPGEPSEQYDLFRLYLMQRPRRKMTVVARSKGVTAKMTALHSYARKWRWRERAMIWDRHLARRLDAVMFQHTYETQKRNLKKINAAVDTLVANIEAANVGEMSQAMARSMYGQNLTLLMKTLEMEGSLLRLGSRKSCPWCMGR